MQRLGGAGGCRNHGQSGCAGAAQVLVGKIERDLVIGVRVDGGHGAALDLEVVVDDLGHWSEAVRSAGGVGNNIVFGGIVLVFIHAQHNGDVFVFGGSGDDDLLDRAAQVLFGLLRVSEFAG